MVILRLGREHTLDRSAMANADQLRHAKLQTSPGLGYHLGYGASGYRARPSVVEQIATRGRRGGVFAVRAPSYAVHRIRGSQEVGLAVLGSR
jgi:hypothetical protein